MLLVAVQPSSFVTMWRRVLGDQGIGTTSRSHGNKNVMMAIGAYGLDHIGYKDIRQGTSLPQLIRCVKSTSDDADTFYKTLQVKAEATKAEVLTAELVLSSGLELYRGSAIPTIIGAGALTPFTFGKLAKETLNFLTVMEGTPSLFDGWRTDPHHLICTP
ncbi:hypothetical protein RB195_001123 [Necator americanus]|uniref:Uncharacterized protein n=1 Tax=Necator americanus TaxID=51031 RepID=A0ABR1DCT4_NECAM